MAEYEAVVGAIVEEGTVEVAFGLVEEWPRDESYAYRLGGRFKNQQVCQYKEAIESFKIKTSLESIGLLL
jgi:hypothetical protein